MPEHYTRIVLAQRPKGNIDANTFRQEVIPFDLKPAKGEVLVQIVYISLDPAMRGWINDARGYMEPVKIGETMRAGCLGVVSEAGEDCSLKRGDYIQGMLGWCEWAVVAERKVQKVVVPEGAELLDFLGLLGNNGYTAYFGLFDIGQVKPGETLVVSGAAGATGSIVCQLGKMVGAKVIAIAGSDDKCRWLKDDLGVDAVLNYKSPNFQQEFVEKVGYLDVFFDNVGGEILDLALRRLKIGARIAFCGAISDYNQKPKGLTAYMNLISQRARLQGFLVFDYVKEFPKAAKELAQWLQEGKLKRKFHVVQGLDKAPEALPLLYSGGNTGKLIVQVTQRANL